MYLKIAGKEISVDLENAPLPELASIRDRLIEERQNINAQLTQKIAVNGVGGDLADWQQRAALALQYKDSQIKILENALDRRNLTERNNDVRSGLLAVEFMRVVADRHHDIYIDCMARAQEKISEQLFTLLSGGAE